MTAFERLLWKYDVSGSFPEIDREVVDWFCRGYVVVFPDMLVMGRPVDVASGLEAWKDLDRSFDVENGWYVHWVVGDLKKVLTLVPFQLPYICYERRGVARVQWSDRIWRKLNG